MLKKRTVEIDGETLVLPKYVHRMASGWLVRARGIASQHFSDTHYGGAKLSLAQAAKAAQAAPAPELQRRGPKAQSPDGVAMSHAQRKALQRERDRLKLESQKIEDLTLEALLTVIGKAVTERRPGDLTALFNELRKRAKGDA